MRKIITGLLCAAVVSLGATPAEAKTLRHTYSSLYKAVAKRYGKRTPGRHIVKWGVRTKHGTRKATYHELGRSIRTFRRWLAPPVAPVVVTDRAPVSRRIASTPSYAGGRYSIPASIVMCESGGDYGAVNASSGARGAYQLMPSTYYAYGGDGSWSPADQDRVAARVWQGQGRGAWVC